MLRRPEGELAYDVAGDGPLMICSPDVGDLRGSYRTFAARMVQEGFRVATLDLRGHGGSSTGWATYGEDQLAGDLLALADDLSPGPVVLVGNCVGAGAALRVAAVRPDRVAALVLLNPEIEPGPAGLMAKMRSRLAVSPMVGRKMWTRYWQRLHVRRPADLPQRQRDLTATLSEPGRFEALLATRSDDPPPTGLYLHRVVCPVLVIMGEADPAVADPALQAQTVAEHLGGPARVLVIPGVGHYPQAEVPEIAAGQTSTFLRTLARL
jgi:pimeloyl-ACP methyl ester carboxylesterase